MGGSPVKTDSIAGRSEPLSQKVANGMVRFIFEHNLKPGDRLPSERELGEHFQVSRTVIREAVRSLVGRGIVQSQLGKRLVVSEANTNAVGDALELVVRNRVLGGTEASHETLLNLHEVRSMLEVHIAGLAAQRATEGEIDYIRSCAQALEGATTIAGKSSTDMEFHRAIAAAAHNEFYLVLLDSLQRPLRILRMATYNMQEGIPDAIRLHARIIDRIVAHDVEGARAAMAVHITESGEALKRMDSSYLAKFAYSLE